MPPSQAKPLTQGQIAGKRFKAFAHETLAAAVCPLVAPLTAEVFQTPDRISLAEAKEARYSPVRLGWHWGPAWSTAWFRVRGTVPAAWKGMRVGLRFSTATEALIWRDDIPDHGFDANRDTAVLFPASSGGEPIDLSIEAACNHVLGITDQLFWEPPEQQARWREPTPGRFERCELVTVNQDAWRLVRTFEFVRLLLEQTADGSPRLAHLIKALEQVSAGSPADSLAILHEALARSAPQPPSVCWTVGHAHLDTAWLWPIAETKRKALRTFANSLRLMERFPDYHFLCTQPQQYQWVKEQSPELFQQVQQRVTEGRWEPMGAMWIEPDGNLPSGESFIRQILHANTFWKENFPDFAPQRLAYLPDTFGFAASLPQIFRLAGLDTFITNKLWWNETNEFPHIHFRWRGIDGTDILSHLTPGQEYNATNTPVELLRGQRIMDRKSGDAPPMWLQPFGFGDGGGGPTDWTILHAKLSNASESLPGTMMNGAADFCRILHAETESRQRHGVALAIHEGELYLERHRGTYTTQARVKKGNAQAEASLRIAEWLTFAAPTPLPDSDRDDAVSQLDTAWKLTLLNQFHDILPGSSIGEVYTDAARDHESVRITCEGLEQQAIARWTAAANTTGMNDPILVFNPASHNAAAWVAWKDRRGNTRSLLATDVPALGYRVFDAATAPAPTVRVDGHLLDNGLVRATLDDSGRVTSLRRANCPDNVSSPLNQLTLYSDRPAHWDAWDIDADYINHAQPVETPAKRELTTLAGLPAIRFSRSLGRASRIEQTYSLTPASPRLTIYTRIQWHEDRTVLRALLHTNIRATHATYEIPFGHIQRPTTRDNPIDKAKFEVPAHRWMDLSDPAGGRGLAVLNDCKYGHSCHGSVMGLSLLRSPKWPDPATDMGGHEFTYSLMPHAGDWRAAGVDREAELMVRPMWAVPLTPGHQGACGTSWATFRISGTAAVRIAAIKPAEFGRGIIVRLVENHGRTGSCRIDCALPITSVQSVDLLERPLALPITHNAESRSTTFDIKPFQIVSLALNTE